MANIAGLCRQNRSRRGDKRSLNRTEFKIHQFPFAGLGSPLFASFSLAIGDDKPAHYPVGLADWDKNELVQLLRKSTARVKPLEVVLDKGDVSRLLTIQVNKFFSLLIGKLRITDPVVDAVIGIFLKWIVLPCGDEYVPFGSNQFAERAQNLFGHFEQPSGSFREVEHLGDAAEEGEFLKIDRYLFCKELHLGGEFADLFRLVPVIDGALRQFYGESVVREDAPAISDQRPMSIIDGDKQRGLLFEVGQAPVSSFVKSGHIFDEGPFLVSPRRAEKKFYVGVEPFSQHTA